MFGLRVCFGGLWCGFVMVVFCFCWWVSLVVVFVGLLPAVLGGMCVEFGVVLGLWCGRAGLVGGCLVVNVFGVLWV